MLTVSNSQLHTCRYQFGL